MATKRKATKKATKKTARKSAKRTLSATRHSTAPVRRSPLDLRATGVRVSPHPPVRPPGLTVELTPEWIQRLIDIIGHLDHILWVLRATTQVICLHEDSGPDSAPSLSMDRRDMVVWKNHDATTRTIRFDGDCPLVGFPAAGVTLASGQNSDAYQVRTDVGVDRYVYVIDPPYMVGGGGPGEPVIIVEG